MMKEFEAGKFWRNCGKCQYIQKASTSVLGSCVSTHDSANYDSKHTKKVTQLRRAAAHLVRWPGNSCLRETCNYSTVPVRTHDLSLSTHRWIQSAYFHPFSKFLFNIILAAKPMTFKDPILLGFPTTVLQAFLICQLQYEVADCWLHCWSSSVNAKAQSWEAAVRSPASKLKLKFHALSPRANYTDRATAAYRGSDLRIEGETWSAWRIPIAIFSVF
jgi:hypothetical protein